MSTPSLYSGLGIISCVLNIAALISLGLIVIIEGISKFIMLVQMFMGIIIIVIMWLFTAGFLCLSLEDIGIERVALIEPWMLIIPGIFIVIALGFAIAGLMQSEKEKFFTILGCLLSIGGLSAIFSTIKLLD